MCTLGYSPPANPQRRAKRMLTVEADPDLGVVVFVRNLPDIKRFRGRVRQQAEEEDDGVGWGQTFRMDLPGDVSNIHPQRSDNITPRI